jgi:hypothetical protein
MVFHEVINCSFVDGYQWLEEPATYTFGVEGEDGGLKFL